MFGSEARIGFTSSLPVELMFTTESEADPFVVFENNTEAEDVALQSSYGTDSIYWIFGGFLETHEISSFTI